MENLSAVGTTTPSDLLSFYDQRGRHDFADLVSFYDQRGACPEVTKGCKASAMGLWDGCAGFMGISGID